MRKYNPHMTVDIEGLVEVSPRSSVRIDVVVRRDRDIVPIEIGLAQDPIRRGALRDAKAHQMVRYLRTREISEGILFLIPALGEAVLKVKRKFDVFGAKPVTIFEIGGSYRDPTREDRHLE